MDKYTNITIELNEQQQELIKAFMQDVLDDSHGTNWSNTTKSVAQQIINKIDDNA